MDGPDLVPTQVSRGEELLELRFCGEVHLSFAYWRRCLFCLRISRTTSCRSPIHMPLVQYAKNGSYRSRSLWIRARIRFSRAGRGRCRCVGVLPLLSPCPARLCVEFYYRVGGMRVEWKNLRECGDLGGREGSRLCENADYFANVGPSSSE